MPALKWLRLSLNHVPDKYEHLVRYYGNYSSHSRGAHRRAELQTEEHTQITIDDQPPDWRRKANWVQLMQKVYKVDPLEYFHMARHHAHHRPDRQSYFGGFFLGKFQRSPIAALGREP
jgi:hypothetical protein